MALFNSQERQFVDAITRIAYCNPFLPERIEAEATALGDEFVEKGSIWHASTAPPATPNLNVTRLSTKATAIANNAREALLAGHQPTGNELEHYADLVRFALYHEFEDPILGTISSQLEGKQLKQKIQYYPEFQTRYQQLIKLPALASLKFESCSHLFALFSQVRRAFYQIFSDIVGGSIAIARLRGAIWQSIFTHDMVRYRRFLYNRMGEVTTLITGPSGTGKELVARAIGSSRYIPFDSNTQKFTEDFVSTFYPLNISALSSTLIESELFGHRRGSFTGASYDHIGWFEQCGPLGSVFLDEIGELDPVIQVKLLRLLQTGTFQRLGDTQELNFSGKIIAATNQDLAEQMQQSRFRQDFYYRLCSDIIKTPALNEQLKGSMEETTRLVQFISERLIGDEGSSLAEEVMIWIPEHLGLDYHWPGNFRELEQCVRNVMIRGHYQPQAVKIPQLAEKLSKEFLSGTLTADEILRRYCTLAYAQLQNYEGVARKIGLDRRTIKAKVDLELLKQIENEGL